MIVGRRILRCTEDSTVTFALFGNLPLDGRLTGAEAIVRTDMVALLIFDHHIAGTPAFAVKHFVPSQSHQDSLGHIVVGIVDPAELLADLIGKLFGLFELFEKFVGTHIDLFHGSGISFFFNPTQGGDRHD